jgi:hypothetical protein
VKSIVTQLAAEAFTAAPAATRTTQLATEIFQSRPTAARATQLAVEVFVPRPVLARATHALVEVYQARAASLAATSIAVEVFVPASDLIGGLLPPTVCDGALPIDAEPPGGSCPPAFFDPDSDENWS